MNKLKTDKHLITEKDSGLYKRTERDSSLSTDPRAYKRSGRDSAVRAADTSNDSKETSSETW